MDFSWIYKTVVRIEPFRWQNYALFTNGSILIRLPAQNYNGELESCSPFHSKRLTDLFPDLSHRISLKPFPSTKSLGIEPGSWLKECPKCKGAGKVAQCPECEGEGVVSWETAYHEYEATCQTCWGDKLLPGDSRAEQMECADCSGTGKSVWITPCQVYDSVISTFYAYHLSLLKGCKIQINGTEDQVYFVFDGGDGIVMKISLED